MYLSKCNWLLPTSDQIVLLYAITVDIFVPFKFLMWTFPECTDLERSVVWEFVVVKYIIIIQHAIYIYNNKYIFIWENPPTPHFSPRWGICPVACLESFGLLTVFVSRYPGKCKVSSLLCSNFYHWKLMF